MKPIGWIYLTTNIANGKIYVGKHEISNDKKINANYIGSGELFKRALDKYGKEKFKRKILRLCYSLHELRVWEHVYIVKYKSHIRSIGYNIAKGDVNTSEYNPAKLPEVRKKMSLKKKGKPSSFKGKKLSDEAKRTISQKNKGKVRSEKFKERMIEIGKKRGGIMTGKHHTEEAKKKISKATRGKNNPMYGVSLSGKLNGMYGKRHSEETKRKISEAQKARFKSTQSLLEII